MNVQTWKAGTWYEWVWNSRYLQAGWNLRAGGVKAGIVYTTSSFHEATVGYPQDSFLMLLLHYPPSLKIQLETGRQLLHPSLLHFP